LSCYFLNVMDKKKPPDFSGGKCRSILLDVGVTLSPVILLFLFRRLFRFDPFHTERVFELLLLFDLHGDHGGDFPDQGLEGVQDQLAVLGKLLEFLDVVFDLDGFDLEFELLLRHDGQVLHTILHDLSIGESLTLRQLIEQTQPGVRSGYWGAPLP